MPALREALAENGIHPEVMTTKGLDRMAQDIEQSPARDTVEISDAAREAGGWEYYYDRQICEYRRLRDNISEVLTARGWAHAAMTAFSARKDPNCFRLTSTEVDELALSNPAFAREHFAEQQSEERPDRHLSDDEKVQNILGNVAGALCGGPGALTESEGDGIRRHFADYAEYKDKTHLSQARFAIERILYERQQQARKSVSDGVIAYLRGGEA